jgi:hypothetical protein
VKEKEEKKNDKEYIKYTAAPRSALLYYTILFLEFSMFKNFTQEVFHTFPR